MFFTVQQIILGMLIKKNVWKLVIIGGILLIILPGFAFRSAHQNQITMKILLMENVLKGVQLIDMLSLLAESAQLLFIADKVELLIRPPIDVLRDVLLILCTLSSLALIFVEHYVKNNCLQIIPQTNV